MAKFERLTYRDKNGEVLLDSTNTDIDRAVYRLSAYEDTGLSPEEVKRRAWVRVEDGLPPKYVPVQVAYIDEGSGRTYCYLTAKWFGEENGLRGGWFWCDSDDNNDEVAVKITHWCYLNDAPKEERQWQDG